MSVCLAIDMGASGGRHIIGKMENGKLVMREIYRFENGMKEENGSLIWDVDSIFAEIMKGLKACRDAGEIPDTIAIDTWGVDYVLLDDKGETIYPCMAYRDSRTETAPDEIEKIVPFDELYERTGILKATYNTIYQLWCDKKSGKLSRAAHILMLPNYFSYRLTGVMKNEYTMASTSALVDVKTRQWDMELIAKLGYPEHLFAQLSEPGTSLGKFSPEIEKELGFSAEVLLCPAHDTQSAILACPIGETSVFLSSGTWSLVGAELDKPMANAAAKEANFSNEGGAAGKYCFLKNIMGMWLFQSIRRETGKKYTYDEMMYMAMESGYKKLIDPTDNAFLAPESMIEAVRTYLGEPNLPLADVLSSIYFSLAETYRKTVEEIRKITGKKIDTVNIVGGGCQDAYLNRLTGEVLGCRVTAGPIEGTAAGNILSQMMALDKTFTLDKARECVKNTFEIKEI